MIRAYKYRLYPTDEQKAYFAKAFGCCRYAYNYCVREHERYYEATGDTATDWQMMAAVTEHKQGLPWLDEADASMLQYAAMRVAKGWDKHFECLKHPDKYRGRKVNPPHEHKKGERQYQSYTCTRIQVNFRHGFVNIPLIGSVRAALHRRFRGTIKCATIRQEASGRYHISLFVETADGPVPMKPLNPDDALGIDVGVRHFLTLSTGEHIEMPDVAKSLRRKAFLQRRLKAQKEGSKGYKKTKQQIARLSEHISNVRLDFHHKTAASLCAGHSAICMETLNVDGMKRGVGGKKEACDTGFNRQLQHVGLGRFSDLLEEKALRTGTRFARIDRWEPSTKRCHVCGHISRDITLDVEEWTCPECGTRHDRDHNAAINILHKGLEALAARQQPADTEEQLPPAEGKVKPAKEPAPAVRRTGRAGGHNASGPSTQIDDGTARPRLANQAKAMAIAPVKGGYDYAQTMMYYVCTTTVARLSGVTGPGIDSWAKTNAYAAPRPFQVERMLAVADAYLEVASMLRRLVLYERTLQGVREYVTEARRLVQLNKVAGVLGIADNTLKGYFALLGTPQFRELHTFISATLPGMIEAECAKIKQTLEGVVF